ncbi:MAG TPA: hypothetical protein VMU34_20360 [Mycobacterium sp.]|nr:hypothetical protein [Mycobacterium sp.]
MCIRGVRQAVRSSPASGDYEQVSGIGDADQPGKRNICCTFRAIGRARSDAR